MPVVTIGDNTGDDYPGFLTANMYEDEATTYSANLDVGKYGAGLWRMGVVKATGIDSLPDAVTVNAATLFAFLINDGGGTHTFTARKFLRAWVDTEITWTVYSTGNNWTTGGAQSNGNDRSSTITGTSEGIGTSGVYYDLIQDSAQLRADIENDAASGGNGWHIERTDAANDATFKFFRNSTDADGSRPYLEVDYTEGTASVGLGPVIRQNYRNMGYS